MIQHWDGAVLVVSGTLSDCLQSATEYPIDSLVRWVLCLITQSDWVSSPGGYLNHTNEFIGYSVALCTQSNCTGASLIQELKKEINIEK